MQKIYTLENGQTHVETINTEPDIGAQQQFKEDVEINNIVRKYQQTGQWTHLAKTQGVYADLSNPKTYHEAMQVVLEADQAFSLLPSNLRTRFQNDPSQLLSFLSDPNNRDEAIQLGLLNSPPSTPQTSQTPSTPQTKTPKTKTPIQTLIPGTEPSDD